MWTVSSGVSQFGVDCDFRFLIWVLLYCHVDIKFKPLIVVWVIRDLTIVRVGRKIRIRNFEIEIAGAFMGQGLGKRVF